MSIHQGSETRTNLEPQRALRKAAKIAKKGENYCIGQREIQRRAFTTEGTGEAQGTSRDFMTRWKEIIGGSEGAEIAEAALVLPIAFLILLGIYWFGLAFNIYGTITHAAQEGARVAVANTCATCGNAVAGGATVTGAVKQSLLASHLDPNRTSPATITPTGCNGGSSTCTTLAGPPPVTYCTNVQLVATPPASSGSPACGIAVAFTYPYQMVLPFTSLNGKPMTMTANVQMRAEQ